MSSRVDQEVAMAGVRDPETTERADATSMTLGLRPPQADVCEDEAVVSPVAVPDHTEIIPSTAGAVGNGVHGSDERLVGTDHSEGSEQLNTPALGGVHVPNGGHVGDDGSVTKCICDYYHDDGFMVCCDRCAVWQHVECIRQGNSRRLPEKYFCHICEPRELNVERANAVQLKKHLALERKNKRKQQRVIEREERLKQQMAQSERKNSAVADDTTSETEEGSQSDGSDCALPELPDYSSPACANISHDHLPATALVNPDGIKPEKVKRKVIQRQSTSPGSNVLLMSEHLLDAVMMDSFDDSVDVPNGDIWNCKTGAWTQPFDTISSNLVDDDLHAQLKNQVGGASTVPKTEAQSSSNESTSDVHTADRQPCASGATSSEQPCLVNEVRPNRKGIIAAEPIKSGTFLVQFTGHISSRKAFDESTSKQAWICGVLPYVLFYRGHGDLDLVVDARSKGNLARFLRRSCTPNAEVRPFVSNDCFCLGVYTTRDIAKHDEITIGFDFPFEKCKFPVECACLLAVRDPKSCHVVGFSARCMAGLREERRLNKHTRQEKLHILQANHIKRQQELHMRSLQEDGITAKQIQKSGPGRKPRSQSTRQRKAEDSVRPDGRRIKRTSDSISGEIPKDTITPTEEIEQDIGGTPDRKRVHHDDDGDDDGGLRKRRKTGVLELDEARITAGEEDGDDGQLEVKGREQRKLDAILKQISRMEGKGPAGRRKSVVDEVPPKSKRPSVASTPTTPGPASEREKPKSLSAVKSRRTSKAGSGSRRASTQRKRSSQGTSEPTSFEPSPESSSSSSYCDASTPLLMAVNTAYAEQNSAIAGAAALLQLAQEFESQPPLPHAQPMDMTSQQQQQPPSPSMSLPVPATPTVTPTPTPTTPVSLSLSSSGSCTPRMPKKKLTAKSWSQMDTKPTTLDLQCPSESATPKEVSPVSSVGAVTSSQSTAESKPPTVAAPASQTMFSPVVGSAKKRWLQTYQQPPPSPLILATQSSVGSPVATSSQVTSPHSTTTEAVTTLDAALAASSPESNAAVESPMLDVKVSNSTVEVKVEDSNNVEVKVDDSNVEVKLDDGNVEVKVEDSQVVTVNEEAIDQTNMEEKMVIEESSHASVDAKCDKLVEPAIKAEVCQQSNGEAEELPSVEAAGAKLEQVSDTEEEPMASHTPMASPDATDSAVESETKPQLYEDLSPVSEDMMGSPEPAETPATQPISLPIALSAPATMEVEMLSPTKIEVVPESREAAKTPISNSSVSAVATSTSGVPSSAQSAASCQPQMLYSHSPLTSPHLSSPGIGSLAQHRPPSDATSPTAAGVEFRRSSSRSSLSDPRSRLSADSPTAGSGSSKGSAASSAAGASGVTGSTATGTATPIVPAVVAPTKKKVSLSEYRRRTQEVRQPLTPLTSSAPRSPLMFHRDNSTGSNSNPLSPNNFARSPISPPAPPLPDDDMNISPPQPPPPACASPPEIDLSSAPPPLFSTGAAATSSVKGSSHSSTKPAPVYEPVSPDMDIPSPQDTSLYNRRLSMHSSLSSSGHDGEVHWSAGLPGLKVSPLSDADDDVGGDSAQPRMETTGTYTCLPAMVNAPRPGAVATAPQPKSFEQRRQQALQSAQKPAPQQQQIPEYTSRGIPPSHVAAGSGSVQASMIHGASAGVRGMPASGATAAGTPTAVAGHTLVYTGLAPVAGAGATPLSRDPRQSSSSSDPRHAAAAAAGVRPASDPRHAAALAAAAASPQQQQYVHPQHLQSQQSIHQHRHGAPASSSQQAASTRRGQPLLQTPGQQQQQQQQAPHQHQGQFPFQAPGFFQG
eukprot:scpid9219/ scgid2336/ Histone-lysine N-methyltransferase MLL5; Myeloid/lymphoid or mixed-lineage leukemia protein 5 homolog